MATQMQALGTVSPLTGAVTLAPLHERTLAMLRTAEKRAHLRLMDAPYQSEADAARFEAMIDRRPLTPADIAASLRVVRELEARGILVNGKVPLTEEPRHGD